MTSGALDRFGIARALREIGALLQLGDGEKRPGGRGNTFRARAYEKGAEALEELGVDLGTLIDEQRLTSIAGIGEALAAQIGELYQTGRSRMLDRLRAELPPGVLELAQVPNLGIKKVRALHDALGIDSIEALETACRAHRVRTVKGFGPATEAKILAGIQRYRTREDKTLYVEAFPVARRFADWLRTSVHAVQVDVAGELRRGVESTAWIELVASTDDPTALAGEIAKWPLVVSVEEQTEARIALRLANGMRAAVHLVPPRGHAVALLLHTGPEAHIGELVDRASRRGGGAPLKGKTEAAIYQHLDLAFIPPETREDPTALARASEGPLDLVDLEDVRGLVHCHTDWSDGVATLEDMARAADALGVDYMTVTDHSQAAYYAGGLDEDRLKKQWALIDEVQSKVKVKLLRGSETDILADGALDWPDHILEQMDVVIASVHSGFKMDEDTMTRRIVTAMRHPLFKIWGHALGRLVDRRPGYACRVEEVLDAIAESRAAVELNGDPYRLDPEPKWIRKGRERGIKFVVSTDAHSTNALKNARFGVTMARRAALMKKEVLNTLDTPRFMKAVRPNQ